MNGKSSNPPFAFGAAGQAACLMTAALALVACGKHGSAASGSSYSVGGTITGLTAGTVVLAYNDTTTVSIAAGSTTWSFAGSFAAGSSYAVTVLTQPIGELCEVVGGASGATLTAAVDDVAVECSDYGHWTWEAGLNTVNGAGVYGTQGAPSASNLPGARYAAGSWTDSAGNFWLFGGFGYDAAASAGYLNDLWKYTPGTGQWTWVNGGEGDNTSGIYGTLGTAAAANTPGARYAAATWTDAAGNLWVFGGYGYDATGAVGRLNDLWRYAPSTGLWTWVSGSNATDAAGVYGAQGTPAAANVPGARYASSAWTDSAGNLWLFGGTGYDAAVGTGGAGAGGLNDLWRFNPATAQWAWINGGNTQNAAGVYGTQSTAAAGDVPGARQAASAWADSSGNLWLFGGYGYDGADVAGYLNDLWQYSTSTGLWTWVNGSTTGNATAVYGTQGTAAAGNVPGARQGASSWIDSAGNLWLFGGAGSSAIAAAGNLNDLWRYSPSAGQWTYVIGGSGDNAAGAYGTQGAISPSTAPGARQAASAWIDSNGTLWLFGGAGEASTGSGSLNDLWQYVPP